MACLAKKDFSGGSTHLLELEKLSKDSAVHSVSIFGLTTATDLLNIAVNVLKGELMNRNGQMIDGIEHLKRAVELEDKLKFREPPDWVFSVRHNLGAVYMENKMYKEAEKVFREDLKKYPANGWALKGLKEALSSQGRVEEAIKIAQEFREAWKNANVTISAARIL